MKNMKLKKAVRRLEARVRAWEMLKDKVGYRKPGSMKR